MNSTPHSDRPLAAVILAAGKGTRMDSDLPKVAHPVADRAMVEWVVDACREVGAERIILVVGYGQDAIRAIFAGQQDIVFAEQLEQLGTAHAVESAREALAGFEGDVLILCGDGPLIRRSTLTTMLNRHTEKHADATLASATITDPTGYGRIVRDDNGGFLAIVEHRVATPDQLAIHEINPSYYCFRTPVMLDTLSLVDRNPVSGEYYLTDAPGLIRAGGGRVEVIDTVPAEDVLSINTPEQLAEVDRILTARLEACP